jgi:hypothetical protein
VKYLLLDIDFTTFWGRVPRPYLKDFLERHQDKYQLGFFTGANGERLAEAFRLLYDLEVDYDLVTFMRMNSLCADTCPIIHYKTPHGSYIDIKCFDKAASLLNCKATDIILLDDMLRHGHPYTNQYIQAPQFNGEKNDVYLKQLEINL